MKGTTMKITKYQRGHFDFGLLYMVAGIAGLFLAGGGIWLLVFAYRGLA